MTVQDKPADPAARAAGAAVLDRTAPNVSTRARRALFCAIRQMRAAVDQQLESAVRFHTPFFSHGLLVVVGDQMADLESALSIISRPLPPWIKPICLRRSELFQLSLPNPNAPATFNLSWWIREEGETLWGRDLRSSIPKCDVSGLLTYHLEFAVHHIRNRVILDALTQQEYPLLIQRLHEERIDLMITALLARDVWRVYPETVAARFLECYPAFHCNVREFAELYARRREVEKRAAYRAAWLFEMFVRGLRQVVKPEIVSESKPSLSA